MSSTSGPTELGSDDLIVRGAQIMEGHWRPQGFTCPNGETYPWLWLWDSCFHSIIWATLGDRERAVAELSTALSAQDPDGFTPHLVYLDGSDDHSSFWGRSATSSITQPPVYGHAIAVLQRSGFDVPDDLQRRATAGLKFLLKRRRRSESGLIELVHPWESGCDDSPRWDDLMAPDSSADGPDPYNKEWWFERKEQLLGTIVRSSSGAPLYNPQFDVGSVAFSAITAFCCSELASVNGDAELQELGLELATSLRQRWSENLRTWVDDGSTSQGSGQIRTLEGLLPLLVESDRAVVDVVLKELADPEAFAGEFGTWQVDQREPRFARGAYWRGPAWPQLDYLMWLAIKRIAPSAVADSTAARVRSGVARSGFAEFWDADDAKPGGAVPQSWAALGLCME